MPPINIDGSTVDSVTVDGQTVDQITVDGTNVLSTESIVDNFEEGLYENQNRSLSDYYGGNISRFSRQQTTVFEGSYAIECTGDNTRINSVPGTGQDLPNYPSQGDSIVFWTFLVGNSDSRFAFGVQGESAEYNEDSYEIQFRPLNDRYELSLNGQTLDTNDNTPPTNQWIRTTVDWGTDDSISITIEDESGTTLATLSATDSTYTDGGIGFGAREVEHYHDLVSIQ